MLTFENVLEVFEDYLREDTEREIMRTRHCYTVLLWDTRAHDWDEAIPCETPEKLFDILLENYQMYQTFLLMGEEGEITDEIEARVKEMCAPYRQRRQDLEQLPPTLTFDNVLSVFSDYLAEEDSCEVVVTSHGYALLDWDNNLNDFQGTMFCPTPEDLRDILVARYEEYQEFLITGGYKRDVTDEDRAEARKRSRAMRDKCRRAVGKKKKV